jgi:polyhydroxyalkanoate synthesis regulator phasin
VTTDQWVLIILAVLSLAGGSGTALIIVKWLERNKTDAEAKAILATASDTIQKASSELVETMAAQLRNALERINALEQAGLVKDRKIFDLEREVTDLKKHITKLEDDQ